MAEKKAAATSDGNTRNNYRVDLSADDGEALRWIIQRVKKLMADRKMTADTITEVRRSAVNDGFGGETISGAIRLAKMSPERRSKFAKDFGEALQLYGFASIDISSEDPAGERPKLLKAHVNKTISLVREKAEIGAEIRLIYTCAKERNLDVPAIKQVVKLAHLDPEDRSDWFARVDKIGAFLGYW